MGRDLAVWAEAVTEGLEDLIDEILRANGSAIAEVTDAAKKVV